MTWETVTIRLACGHETVVTAPAPVLWYCMTCRKTHTVLIPEWWGYDDESRRLRAEDVSPREGTEA